MVTERKENEIHPIATDFVNAFSDNALPVLVDICIATGGMGWMAGGYFFEQKSYEILDKSRTKLTENDTKLLTYGFLRDIRWLLNRDNSESLSILAEMTQNTDQLDKQRGLLALGLSPFLENKDFENSIKHVLHVISLA